MSNFSYLHFSLLKPILSYLHNHPKKELISTWNLQKKQKFGAIPIELTEEEFYEFIFPDLSEGSRGPKPKISLYKIFNYILYFLHTGCQWFRLPIEKDKNEKPKMHYTRVFRIFSRWSNDGSLEKAFDRSVLLLKKRNLLDLSVIHGDGSATAAKKGGNKIGFDGHKKVKGEEVLAMTDRNGFVLVPAPTEAANCDERSLLPEALDNLKAVSKMAGFSVKGSILSLDGLYGFPSIRKLIFNRGMIPNMPENKGNRKKPKRGRKQNYSKEIYQERFNVIERTFAWEDKFKRLLIRQERKSKNHFSLKLIAYVMINLRPFCQASLSV